MAASTLFLHCTPGVRATHTASSNDPTNLVQELQGLLFAESLLQRAVELLKSEGGERTALLDSFSSNNPLTKFKYLSTVKRQPLSTETAGDAKCVPDSLGIVGLQRRFGGAALQQCQRCWRSQMRPNLAQGAAAVQWRRAGHQEP
jgi:hypothetical protein